MSGTTDREEPADVPRSAGERLVFRKPREWATMTDAHREAWADGVLDAILPDTVAADAPGQETD
jgi:hypothetical protein